MIWVGTPVRDDAGHIIAVLSLGVSADYQFTRILSVARLGYSGETYAFDENAWLLSDSRFTDQLKELGLIPNDPEVRAIFNMQVRDPGVDLTTGAKAKLSAGAQPLTKMAALAIAREDGIDVDGYRDYRGVPSIGAWRWLPQYGFGVATEVDCAEAYSPLRYPLIASWLPLGVLIVAAGGFLYSAFHIASLQRQIGVARQVGQYTLEEKIGEGGMGVVYRARHSMLRRRTAVKLLKPEHMTPVAIARFEREVQLASQLTHPNTIEIYDFGRTTDGVFYYAMEYLPGASLAQLIQIEGAVPPGRAVYILKQICGSLAEAHGIGLAHRDVKPHNIMLCERGGQADFIKVLDFGLVKSTSNDENTGLTAVTALAGTPLYMAPERLRDPLVTDTRSDLYSLGAVAYDLLTGRNIFHCVSDLDILFHVINVTPEAAVAAKSGRATRALRSGDVVPGERSARAAAIGGRNPAAARPADERHPLDADGRPPLVARKRRGDPGPAAAGAWPTPWNSFRIQRPRRAGRHNGERVSSPCANATLRLLLAPEFADDRHDLGGLFARDQVVLRIRAAN